MYSFNFFLPWNCILFALRKCLRAASKRSRVQLDKLLHVALYIMAAKYNTDLAQVRTTDYLV